MCVSRVSRCLCLALFVILIGCFFMIFVLWLRLCFFFFQAEDGIRDLIVTGVQTCALRICVRERRVRAGRLVGGGARGGGRAHDGRGGRGHVPGPRALEAVPLRRRRRADRDLDRESGV